MITFDPYGPAPLAVRIGRVLLPLLLCAGYLGLRVYPATDGRIPLGEVIVMGVVFAGLVLVALVAAADLIYPARIVRADSPSELEITAALTPVADIEATAAQACAAEIRRLDALLRGDEWRRHSGTLPVVKDGPPEFTVVSPGWHKCPGGPCTEIDEPELMTHEFTPMHHTPPRGIPVITVPNAGWWQAGATDWDGVFRVPEVKQKWVMGEIRWANCERTGQLFGELS